jgi:Zn-dependent peptidase ImmA (M78 family)
MVAIANALSFPVSFFSGPPIEEIVEDNASFRALSSMTASQRDRVFAAGAIAINVSTVLEEQVTLPACAIPDLRWEDPVAAADALREHWKMGVRPIKNVVHLLEFHGIRVFSLADECASVDAFSLWRHDVPYVFVNRSKSGERGRFDVAHELGHLVLHRRGVPHGREAERDADAFASAFLMPKETVIPVAPRAPRIKQLLQLKANWKVSAAALARRLKDLNLVTEWQYQTLCVELSRLGYRSAPEPDGVEQEVSQLLPKAFAVLREKGVDPAKLSELVGLLPSELAALTFGYVLVPLDGGLGTAKKVKGKVLLRLV